MARRRRSVISLGVVAALLGLGLSVWFLASSAGDGPPEGVETFSGLSRGHVEGNVDYQQKPPVGGDHAPVWQNCGFYTSPVAEENAVHSMEHGAVWITYRPDLSPDDVTELRALGQDHPYVLVSPYPGLAASVVVSAWGAQLRLSSADDPRLEQFVSYYERGPQTPEPGAPCTGGLGGPASG